MLPWTIIGWFVVICGCVAVVLIFGFILKAHADQWWANIKRKRAHAGKVKCESKQEKCTNLARYVTPNGYSCEEHEGVMSKKMVLTGSVQYAHRLNYTINSERQR